MATQVSQPVYVRVYLDDLITGCGYCYEGTTVEDCVAYFQEMFFAPRAHRVTRIEKVDNSIKGTY